MVKFWAFTFENTVVYTEGRGVCCLLTLATKTALSLGGFGLILVFCL